MLKRAVREKFIIIVASSELTMDLENNRIMIETIESFNPSYWALKNPFGYTVYYRSKNKRSGELSKKLYESIRDLILNHPLFEAFKVGINEGEVVTEINWRGKVVFEPLGGSVNDAYKSKKSKIELIENRSQQHKE